MILKLKVKLDRTQPGPVDGNVDEIPAPSAPAQADEAAQNPDTPRRRRTKRPRMVPRSSRKTRSAGPPKDSEENVNEPMSPSQETAAAEHENVHDSPDFEPQPLATHQSQTPEPSHQSDVQDLHDPNQTEEEHSAPPPFKQPTPGPYEATPESVAQFKASTSPGQSRKRASTLLKDETLSPEPVTKKAKFQEAKATPESMVENIVVSGAVSQEDAMITDQDTPEEVPRGELPKRGRGGRGGSRGRRGARGNRARGGRGGATTVAARSTASRGRGTRGGPRGGARGGARGNRLRGGPKSAADETWDGDNKRRTPSPGPILDFLRQRMELVGTTFKTIAGVQVKALSHLAGQQVEKIAKDKDYVKSVPEFIELQQSLAEHKRSVDKALKAKYELEIEEAKRVYAGEVEIIKKRYNVSFSHEKFSNLLSNRYLTLSIGSCGRASRGVPWNVRGQSDGPCYRQTGQRG